MVAGLESSDHGVIEAEEGTSSAVTGAFEEEDETQPNS